MIEFEKLNIHLQYFFQILRDRWVNGLKRLQNQINLYEINDYRRNLKQNDIINSPIHNIIEINNDYIFLLLDSIFMQRLRGIHHQGLAYLVYPTAIHSRFDHSLGAYKLTNDIVNSMMKNTKSNFKNCEFTSTELLIAALLHDIGHYPFSHIGENIFGDIKSKLLPIFPNIIKILPKHEARTANIILGKDIFIELKEFHGLDLNPNNYFKKIFKIINSFEDEKIKIDNVSTLIEGLRINNHDIGHLINGPIDVDKMDYILREAYFTGTPFGNIDIHRIIQGYLIRNIKKEGNTFKNQLVFNKRMLTSILQMNVGR